MQCIVPYVIFVMFVICTGSVLEAGVMFRYFCEFENNVNNGYNGYLRSARSTRSSARRK